MVGQVRSVRISSRRGSVEVIAETRDDVVAHKDGEPVQPAIEDGITTIASRRSPLRVSVPEGTDVVIGTVSGNVTCTGPLGHVAVHTVSSRIEVERATRVDARTVSGRVVVGNCEGEVRCDVGSGRAEVETAGAVYLNTTSGRIVARRVRGKMRARSVSGRIQVGLTETPLDAKVECVSGRIQVRVPRGARPTTRLVTKHGRVTNPLVS